jgi:hypothetical protein
MSNTQDYRNVTSNFARLTAGILFVALVAMGHVISPRVESAVDFPAQVEEQNAVDASLPSACVGGGLVFADCDLDI